MTHFRSTAPRGATLHPETGLLSYSPEALAALQAKLSGEVTQPGYPGYNDDRMVFMHTYQAYPQLIVHAGCETDVIAALDFAREQGLKVTARSGGHSTAGFSSGDQIVIDTAGMDHVLVDPAARTARVGAGTQFRKLNRVLDHYRLHVPGGGCETVAVAGYMQGGGFGFTSRLFGMNCDNVLSFRMVTPDGEIRHCDAAENADLYWAVRGGTGNQFGILTEITYRLYPLADVWAFGLRFALSDAAGIATAARVMALLQAEYAVTGPAKMGQQALLMFLPTEAEPEAQLPVLLVRGLYDGTEAECEAALGPLLAHVTDRAAQVEIWRAGRYLEVNEALLQTVHPPGLDMPNVSMNTKPLVDGRIIAASHPAERWQELIAHFLTAPDLTCFIAAEYYGGRINEPAPGAMAYCHRDASLDLFSWAFWTFDATQQAATDWLDGFARIAGAMGNGHRYQNYPRRGNAGFLHDYFGANAARLVEVKRRHDPQMLLDYEQSIPLALPGEESA
ncbi:FAD-binding oxidoreductase [Mangrovicoccus algicola]|uniref:FAD-binding oxidoreductase n=1 Tax=Mangrovicoccus algicola TaxID=2771008 RepID=A0A8J6Z5Q3_9RHOB|nr:FAD-binding oxidoreductase [Mangrovicoccus algicola]MBE3638229.1 FAD-binding oxidoreductase [Mangrovicoccus algicola]